MATKRKEKVLQETFLGFSHLNGIDVLHGLKGEYIVALEITNPIQQYAADAELYRDHHQTYGQIIKVLGEQYIIQKTDIIYRKEFDASTKTPIDYLDEVYFNAFQGRSYYTCKTILTIILQKDKPNYVPKEELDFLTKIAKVADILTIKHIKNRILNRKEINDLQHRFLAFNFADAVFNLNNLRINDDTIEVGNKLFKSKVLVDIEEMNISSNVAPFNFRADLGNHFPSDNFSFLLSTPDVDTIIFSQYIFIPNQVKLKAKLEAKKKKHQGIPDPSNFIAVVDIDAMFEDIAQTNELIVEASYCMSILAEKHLFAKAEGYIDTQLFGMGIIPSHRNYNQEELFISTIPGNATLIKEYDKFLCSRPAACCFLFTENIMTDENSDYLHYYSDRQGIPVGVDTSELPMQTGRITNRNKFILGPSGTGKSFLTNRYVKQCYNLGADIVLVDTGDSYLGTCNYFGGSYITYKEDKPITMNPFKISHKEYNEEKKQFIVSLIGLCWKGAKSSGLTNVEETLLEKVIHDYFIAVFKEEITKPCFDTFYQYSINRIAAILEANHNMLEFNLIDYRFILKKFYSGDEHEEPGQYHTILNASIDNSLFEERFIVFEIDNIKEHPLLFPITTLIIMDIFLQKMRHRKGIKKILIIEEAWKAIASPIMANYILYLYKTVRKFGGEAIVVTQEINDIIGNTIVKDSILANSDTIFLLDQSKFKDRYKEVAELLSLNEVERNKIFTINKLDNKTNRGRFREFYMKRGATGEVYGVEVPLEEYLTYTTEKSEREALELYLDAYTNYRSALSNMVNDLYLSKLTLPQFVKIINSNKAVYAKISQHDKSLSA